MDQDIKQREYGNDGQQIHLYYNPCVDMWAAYGYSAYSLKLQIQACEYDNFCGYSSEFGLPCTVIGHSAVKAVRASARVVDETPGNYVRFACSTAFPMEEYVRWTSELQCRKELKERTIHTRVSELVPRDRFIPDRMSAISRYVKRAGDCLIAFLAMVVFSPLFLLCYILIKHEDGGPAIFKQERIGRFGRPFHIYKFRSMRADAEKSGPQLSSQGGDGDSRLTKVGKFIRTHHLDELPQLWNVFIGDMAFVGYRPERKFYIDQIMEYDKRYSYLYQIRPGVTSYATLHNGYTDTMEKMLQRLEYDLYYLSKHSWLFDMKILFQTFCSIVFGRKF